MVVQTAAVHQRQSQAEARAPASASKKCAPVAEPAQEAEQSATMVKIVRGPTRYFPTAQDHVLNLSHLADFFGQQTQADPGILYVGSRFVTNEFGLRRANGKEFSLTLDVKLRIADVSKLVRASNNPRKVLLDSLQLDLQALFQSEESGSVALQAVSNVEHTAFEKSRQLAIHQLGIVLEQLVIARTTGLDDVLEHKLRLEEKERAQQEEQRAFKERESAYILNQKRKEKERLDNVKLEVSFFHGLHS
jgi:hypothetical protein